MSLLKTIGLAFACALSLSLAACSSEKEQPAAPEKAAAARTTASPAPRAQPARAAAPQAAMTCVDRALAAAPFTGSRRERLHQARHLQIGTTVLINGVQTALKKGDTVWSLCQGPDPRLRLQQLESENARLRVQVSQLQHTAFYADSQGRAYSYKALVDTQAREIERLRDDLKSNARLNGLLLVSTLILLAVAVAFAILWLRRNSHIETLKTQNDGLKYDNGNLSREVDRLKKAHPEDT